MPAAPSTRNIDPFGRIIGFFAPLAALLYFTGWIYRWAYYEFFHIEVSTLGLPFESFYLAAFQVLFGHLIVAKMVGTIVLILVVTFTTLWMRQQISTRFQRGNFLASRFLSTATLRFAGSILDELVAVLLILGVLFWVARWQGQTDATIDAVNETSTLPVVTVVLPNSGPAIGRSLGVESSSNPTGFRVIGNENLYSDLLAQGLNDIEDPDNVRVWRLLLDQDGYFYIFPAISSGDRSREVPVLIVYEGENQLTILSPNFSE